MRIQDQKYLTVYNAIRAVLAYHGGVAKVKATCEAKSFSPLGVMWRLFNVAADNLRYDDNHPHFQSGQWPRIVSHDPTFDMYSNGDNDEHWNTALKKMGRELGLI